MASAGGMGAARIPLHYNRPARAIAPASLALLRKATSVMDTGARSRLHNKIAALLAEGGPMFGPYSTPPFTTGFTIPVLAVNKKDGLVWPVYHCFYPLNRQQPSKTRPLNSGITRDAFWFPTYNSVVVGSPVVPHILGLQPTGCGAHSARLPHLQA